MTTRFGEMALEELQKRVKRLAYWASTANVPIEELETLGELNNLIHRLYDTEVALEIADFHITSLNDRNLQLERVYDAAAKMRAVLVLNNRSDSSNWLIPKGGSHMFTDAINGLLAALVAANSESKAPQQSSSANGPDTAPKAGQPPE